MVFVADLQFPKCVWILLNHTSGQLEIFCVKLGTFSCDVLQGPDAVTYETLTLAHFLDRADRLAACAEEIKALNAQVLQDSSIKTRLPLSIAWASAFWPSHAMPIVLHSWQHLAWTHDQQLWLRLAFVVQTHHVCSCSPMLEGFALAVSLLTLCPSQLVDFDVLYFTRINQQET